MANHRHEASEDDPHSLSEVSNFRAQLERKFEAMMGDDWRYFRASLYSDEQYQQQIQQGQTRWMYNNNDPFTINSRPADELSVSIPKIDKSQWAHPISHIEPGCVLIANERLGGLFHQTVVLITEHDEIKGTVGLIVNRPLLDTNLFERTTDDGSEGKGNHNKRNFQSNVELAFREAPVSFGGPLQSLPFSLVHSFGRVDNSVELVPGIYVGGSEALANEALNNQFQTDQALFCKGHAAWLPGRLEHEISKGVWYTAAAAPDLIFRYANSNESNRSHDSTDLWGDILSIMGDKYANKAQAYARQGDVRAIP
eukprot:CAMPEP_0198296208 /NCGR_PEP_ID=MMETSP1449-20131203/31498_1 /TAXON_ID=420275 /ORGANISM="Attheya septentrionalis, Strain CCMP2084" /LENGTH=310 /DNA_ID=CAMNT_0043996755 /DNA_START=271 /DNA_END=1203 /DNA_ORIENTATION=-